MSLLDHTTAPGQAIAYLGGDDEIFQELSRILGPRGLGLSRLLSADVLRLRDPEILPGVVLYEPAQGPAVAAGGTRRTQGFPLFIPILAPGESPEDYSLEPAMVHDTLERPFVAHRVGLVVTNAKRLATTLATNSRMSSRIRALNIQWHKLNEIGAALTAFHDIDQLLDFILKKCREITCADSGSLYLKETSPDPGAPTMLRFKVAQNDSKFIPFKEWTMPARKESISGYVALEGQEVLIDDVYQLPADAPFRFDTSFDRASGYRTGSMLVVPMLNPRGEVVGVIQLINKKRFADDLLPAGDESRSRALPFDLNDRHLAVSLASQAAVAIENAHLMETLRRAMHELKDANETLARSRVSIEHLFESFLATCARAIETRSGALPGHVDRIAGYACALAEAVNRTDEGSLARHSFDGARMKALAHAAMLHDIGNIGVREDVLCKATRLKPDRMEAIRYRFEWYKGRLREGAARATVRQALEGPGAALVEHIRSEEEALAGEIASLDGTLAFLDRVNRLGFLADEDLRELDRVRSIRLRLDDEEVALLTDHEYENLAIRRGNLTAREWVEMRRHAAGTREILGEIAWPADLAMVPDWAGSHHERRDGKGYPLGLAGDDIPLAGQILAVVDIYEALTASDRPYRKRFTTEEALDHLRDCARTQAIHPDLVDLFIREKIYLSARPPR